MKNKYKVGYWIILFWLMAPGLSAQTTDLSLSTQLEHLRQRYVPGAAVGLLVMDARSGDMLYQHNSDEAFPPASNTKLFTAASALLALGADYRYQTTLAFDRQALHRGALGSDLYLTFKGDPTLTWEELESLMHPLKALQVHTITGDVVIDATYFSPPNYAPGNTIDSINWYYSAPVSSVIVAQNAQMITLTPSMVLNEKAQVTLDNPPPAGLHLKQVDVTTVSANQAEQWCSLLLEVNRQNGLDLGGCWPITGEPSTLNVAINNPELMVREWLQTWLQTEGMTLEGQVRMGQVPTTLAPVSQHDSVPLSELLHPMLQDSNNLIADSLLKTLGATLYQQGSFKAGVHAVEATLQQPLDLKPHALTLYDGSGLSRYNLATPEVIGQLLYMMYHHPTYPDFHAGLAQSGVTGTLSRRLGTVDLAEHFKGKTGTLNGTSILSGYLQTQTDDLIVVMMLDHLAEPLHTAYNFQSEVLARLYHYTPMTF